MTISTRRGVPSPCVLLPGPFQKRHQKCLGWAMQDGPPSTRGRRQVWAWVQGSHHRYGDTTPCNAGGQ